LIDLKCENGAVGHCKEEERWRKRVKLKQYQLAIHSSHHGCCIS